MHKTRTVIMAAITSAAIIALLGSCAAGKKAPDLKDTVWVGEYGIDRVWNMWTEKYRPEGYFNRLYFHKDEMKVLFRDDYEEYEITNKEYEIDKENNFTIYLYDKADVLAIKEKEPAQWLAYKDSMVFIGKLDGDTLTFPSSRRDSAGGRVFTKSTPEEINEIIARLNAEFAEKEAEYERD